MDINFEELKPLLSQFHKKYGVGIWIGVDNKYTSIKYEIEIKFAGRSKSNNPLIQVDRISNVSVNDKSPEFLVEDLSYETGKVFYPLQLELGTKGEFLSVYNIEEIQIRWEDVRKKVERYFIGDEIHIYLKEMDKIIDSPEKINQSIQLDFFINLFFVPMYRSYTSIPRKEEKVLSINSVPLKYLVGWTLMNELGESGKKKLLCQGNKSKISEDINKNTSSQELTNVEESKDDCYTATYFLNPENDLISEINLSWQIDFTDKKSIIASIYEIEDIWAKEHPKKEKTKKKGFFSFLFE